MDSFFCLSLEVSLSVDADELARWEEREVEDVRPDGLLVSLEEAEADADRRTDAIDGL